MSYADRARLGLDPRPSAFGGSGDALSPGMRVGLLGGSFNPAHEGHRHVSLIALNRLKLDRVWWLLSPQNPLKSASDMASLAQRRARAEAVARHPRIHVTDVECRLGTQYTADTLVALKRRFRGVRFVWLMGADNLAQLPRWDRWLTIMNTMPIAVLDRPGYARAALGSLAAQRFARSRVREERAPELAFRAPPAWIFLTHRLHPASATALRARGSWIVDAS